MYKIWRSPYSLFGGLPSESSNDLTDETITAIEVYTENELSGIASSGFNAIWVHGVLHNMIKSEPFPELGQNSQAHLKTMRQLIEKADRHGIKVFIYMQPPRAIPVSNIGFWSKHSKSGGQVETFLCGEGAAAKDVQLRSLCTSTPEVKGWLKKSAGILAESLPGLAGVILITASEFPSHCYVHRSKINPGKWNPMIECPRCSKREKHEVIAEVVTLMRDGIREASKDMEVIAWNWSWPSGADVIGLLPKDVIIMADFERGGIKDLPGRPGYCFDEYSLSYAGPSERCRSAFEEARKHSMRIMSKLQLGTTHELGSVVSLPLMGNIFEKAKFHRENTLAGFMGCWNFGNMLSANTAGFNYFLSKDCPDDKAKALQSFAEIYFPSCDARLIRIAWETFEQAMAYIPFTIPFLYYGIQSHALSFSEIFKPEGLGGKSAGRSWQLDERGDELADSYTTHGMEFSLDEMIERLGKMAAIWRQGVELMEKALPCSSGEAVSNELGNAVICGAVWASTKNAYEVYRLRLNWDDSKRSEFLRIVSDELAILRQVLPFIERDTRQGYHAEPHGHMFDADSVRLKIGILKLLDI